MKKTLVLFTNKKNYYYFDRIDYSNLCIKSLYKEKISRFEKIILKIFRKLSLPFTKLFYGDWYNNLEEYDKIIVLDATFLIDKNILRNIAYKVPKSERYFYSWNIVNNEEFYEKQRNEVDKTGFKYYSYDLGNCRKYNMKFNTIMYDKSLCLQNVSCETDAIFLGFVKDRQDKMLSLYKIMSDVELKPRFVVVNSSEKDCNMPFEYRDSYVNYYEYLDMINSSKAIIDIAQECQDGYSMRVMEAIFFNKKLITTNVAVKNADFYNANNILVIELGKTTKDEITEFFAKEFCPYSVDIREYYSIESWVERFE